MSTEFEVGVFVNSVMHYFETAVQQPAACGIPHLALRQRPQLGDYTGMVSISRPARRRGAVYRAAQHAVRDADVHAGYRPEP